jgi:hypothetical protein
MKHFVIAGNHYQFEIYKRRKINHLASQNADFKTSDIVYVSNADCLRGYRNPTGVFIGSWRERDDLEQIFFQLLSSTVSLTPAHTTLTTLWDEWRTEWDKRKNYAYNQQIGIAASMLAKEIDKQVLESLMKYTS